MDKILDMVREIISEALNTGKTIEMDLTNRSSNTLGTFAKSESETLHVFISPQSPYTLAAEEEEEEEEEDV